ncbi:RNA polymerase sigma factor [Actinomadura sp. 9N215]|uniref:RNA polymerase sigma factor n=1 Tax=Actinomadura sp. 9N215 TaxID=3375150 RepID=UPI003792038B
MAIEDAERQPLGWFDDLFGRYFHRVYAYAVTRVGSAHAEEVASETFAIAWRRRDVLPDDPLAWLIGVARNVAREQYRDALRQDLIAAELTSWAAAPQVTGDVAELVADRDAVLRGLAALPERDREALMLLGWHGLSTREAAEVLGCSRPALAMRVHRARRHLARHIDGAAHDSDHERGGKTDE